MRDPDLSESDLHVAQWEPYSIEGESAEVSLQALASWMDRHQLKVLHSSTQIIIAPGYDYKIVKMLVTNFHQPQSTLLLLVSAFVKGYVPCSEGDDGYEMFDDARLRELFKA